MNDKPSIQDLRCYVDGELDDAQNAQIEQSLENDAKLREVVEFESRLKNRVLTVFGRETQATPENLADRIRKALANDDSQREKQETNTLKFTGTPGIFAGPQKANIFAVAAVMTIVAGAILFGIFGRPIDEQALPPIVQNGLVESAQYVSNEHIRCAQDSSNLQAKMSFPDQPTANYELALMLGVDSIPLFDLTNLGYTFAGGGRCNVPGAKISGHMMFERDSTDAELTKKVSVFMIRDRGQLDQFSSGKPPIGQWEDCYDGLLCEMQVRGTTDGQVIFFMCCCDQNDLQRVSDLLSQQIRDQ